MIPGLAALLLTSALAGCSTRADASYVLVYLKTGPQNANKSAEERQKIFQGHMDNIHRLADEKKLIIAGPFDHPHDASWRGIFVMDTDNLDEARKLTDTDPGVQSQVFASELRRLVAANELRDALDLEHQRLATQPATRPAGSPPSGIRGYVMMTAQDGERAYRAIKRSGLSSRVIWVGCIPDSKDYSGSSFQGVGVFVFDAEKPEQVQADLDNSHADCGPFTLDGWWSTSALTKLPRKSANWPKRPIAWL